MKGEADCLRWMRQSPVRVPINIHALMHHISCTVFLPTCTTFPFKWKDNLGERDNSMCAPIYCSTSAKHADHWEELSSKVSQFIVATYSVGCTLLCRYIQTFVNASNQLVAQPWYLVQSKDSLFKEKNDVEWLHGDAVSRRD